MSRQPESSPISLKELLIEATFAPNRALRPGVTDIDLGPLGEEAERLFDLGVGEEEIEYMNPALITPDRRLLLRREAIPGAMHAAEFEHQVAVEPNRHLLPKHLRQSLFMGALIHNHPFDAPPSYTDIRRLFLDDLDLHAQTAVLIASPVKKTLMFRGQSTPQWSETYSQEVKSNWDLVLEAVFYEHAAEDMSDKKKKSFRYSFAECFHEYYSF